MATLLDNIKDVCLELDIQAPTAVVSATDSTTLQLLALANRVGGMLVTEGDFQCLVKTHFFNTVFYQYTGDTTAGSNIITNLSSVTGLSTDFMVSGTGIPANNEITAVDETSVTLSVNATSSETGATFTFGQVKYSFPSDYDRMTANTQYQGAFEIGGPHTPGEWQALKTGITGEPFMSFRMIGNKMAIYPMPTSAEVVSFEYISKNWVLSAAGVGKLKYTADDDTSLFPDLLIVLGTKLKFFEVKGFDTTTLFSDFGRELSKYKGSDYSPGRLSMFCGPAHDGPRIRDTGFGA